ncbi:hypothetical protein P7M42_07295, partial [Vibrio parahaemolyticus]|nr:hypothetical protein [Vibrio parahaemolyticus]
NSVYCLIIAQFRAVWFSVRITQQSRSHQELLKVTHTYSTEKSMYVAYPYQNPLPRKLAEISSFIRLELTAILGEK